MKPLHIIGLSALSLVLAACSQSTESSVSDTPSSASVASSATQTQETPSNEQSISSKDGKLSLTLNGQFEDKLTEADQLISDIPAEQLMLLQRDESADVLLYAADLGKAKADANTYLSSLSDTVKADSTLKNIEVGAIDGNKLAYQFSEANGEDELNQACQVVHQEHVYSVCAISASQPGSQLAQLLSKVSVK